jgi:hypothetical protein
MKFDVSLLTGIFLGALIGVVYTGQLTPYLPFIIIGTVVLLLKHVKGS